MLSRSRLYLICLVGRVRASQAITLLLEASRSSSRLSSEFARLIHDQASGSLCLVALVSPLACFSSSVAPRFTRVRAITSRLKRARALFARLSLLHCTRSALQAPTATHRKHSEQRKHTLISLGTQFPCFTGTKVQIVCALLREGKRM